MNTFYYALKGLRAAFSEQLNMKLHALATILVIGAGFHFRITETEWLAIIFAIGFVFVAELFNTSIEYLVDMISPARNVTAGKVKDIAAGAVLISAITALMVGVLVFKSYF